MKSRKSKISMVLVVALFLSALNIFSFSEYAQGASEKSTGNMIVMFNGSGRYIVNGEESYINEDNPDISPVIYNNLVYIPKEFGENVLKIDLNSKASKPDIIVFDDYEYVPLRAVLENMGKSIYFDKGLIVVYEEGSFDIQKNAGVLEGYRKTLSGLPSVGTKEKYEELMENFKWDIAYYSLADGVSLDVMEEPSMVSNDFAVSESSEKQSASDDYSATNIQVEGVDEGDIIKTDGKYIYCVSDDADSAGSIISIINAYPADKMALKSQIKLDDYVREIYIGEDILVLVTYDYGRWGTGLKEYQGPMTNFVVYDIKNIESPKIVRELAVEGSYNSSRKIGNYLYFTANANGYNYSDGNDILRPMFTDKMISQDAVEIGFDRIYYFPETEVNNFLVTGAIDLSNHKKAAELDYYLGSGNNLYVSQKNMYITSSVYNYSIQPGRVSSYNKTNIYKYALNNGKITFSGKGSVSGSELNQFSMDEYKGYFRIATTENLSNGISVNNMHILNASMEKTGEIRGIAPDERIYSVRFMGDKAYMVTFKQTDPLFAMDLSNPYNPVIMGELKIPGYSDYLHPYDENHLIGFGKDTVERNGIAYDGGVKISFFDISDMENPKEKFTEIIGARGTYSELNYNHKALLFSKEKNILAFPVEVYENQKDKYEYGNYSHQGAYVYGIDLENGFELQGIISHTSNKDIYDYNQFVARIIYIGDNLYTFSNNTVKAVDLKTMEEISSVKIR